MLHTYNEIKQGLTPVLAHHHVPNTYVLDGITVDIKSILVTSVSLAGVDESTD